MAGQAELDQTFLDAAYEEAQKGLAEGGIPIGSVLVRNGEIIRRGHNYPALWNEDIGEQRQ